MRVVITGAFSYTGAAVARGLIARGHGVRTLTNRRPPPASDIAASPLYFDADHLVRELRGAQVLVNTYWIRLSHAGQSFATAVRNSEVLIAAAARAGVGRLVHVSVSNARAGAHLGYYAGKAQVEDIVRRAGVPYAIVRPTLVVGPADVLTNNIAWFLRRFPLFPLPGGGRYRLQPVSLDDAARILCDAVEEPADFEVDAAGPEILTFAEYVRVVARACRARSRIVAAPRSITLAALRLVGALLRDVVPTREELRGLEQELLLSLAPPIGRESVTRWVREHGEGLGRAYANDLERHFRDGRRESVQPPPEVPRIGP